MICQRSDTLWHIASRLLFLYFGIFADSKNIIGRNVVKIGKLNKNIGGNISLPKLVITVNLLRAAESRRYHSLRKV